MTAKLIESPFDRHPMNEIETALDLLERSWADFVYGLQGHGRYIRAENRSEMRGMGLATVHRMLEDVYKQQFTEGKRIAIFAALTFCVKENVPLPYWLGDAILDIERKVNREPGNLHELFGLEPLLPAEGKRAETKRQDLQWRQPLWHRTRELMGTANLKKEAALKQARKELNIPYAQRKCRELFDEADCLQSAFMDAWEEGKKHRIK